MIARIIDKRPHDLGGGFEVGRVLPFHARRTVGPYIFFDHMGPAELAPGFSREMDVRPHPHIGISTVTYLFDGALTHRDSLGVRGQGTQPAVLHALGHGCRRRADASLGA